MMRFTIFAAGLVALLSVPATAADEALVIRNGLPVKTADGSRLGRVNRVDKASDGTVSSISLIYEERIIRIPASTLKAADKGLETSLTRQDVRKLK